MVRLKESGDRAGMATNRDYIVKAFNVILDMPDFYFAAQGLPLSASLKHLIKSLVGRELSQREVPKLERDEIRTINRAILMGAYPDLFADHEVEDINRMRQWWVDNIQGLTAKKFLSLDLVRRKAILFSAFAYLHWSLKTNVYQAFQKNESRESFYSGPVRFRTPYVLPFILWRKPQKADLAYLQSVIAVCPFLKKYVTEWRGLTEQEKIESWTNSKG